MSFLGGGGGGGSIGGAGIRISAITQGLRGQVRGAVNDIKGELNNGARQVEQQGQRWNKAFGAIGGAFKLGVIGAGVAVAAAIASAVSFEQAFAGVVKTVDAAPEVLDRLRQRFRQMATEIPISANEFAKLGETAGALGVKASDIEEFARVTALLGVTTNVASDQAATALGQLSNVLKLSAKDYGRFGATLVDLGNKGASTESQILDMSSRVGAAAALIHVSAAETLGWSSAVANLGIEVEAGGSSLQNFFIKMQKLVANKKALKDLGATAGMTGGAFKKLFAEDASQALVVFLKGLGKLTPEAQLARLELFKFNDIRITRTLLGLANNTDNITSSLANANAAWAANTALTAEAEKRFKTTASQLSLLKNRVMELLMSLGDRLLPGFASLVTWVNEKLPAAFAFLAHIWETTLGPAFSSLFGALGRLGGAIGGVIDGMTHLGQASKGAGGGGIVTIIEGIATVASTTVTWVGKLVDLLASLLSNPIIRGLSQLALGFMAVATAVGLGRAAVEKLQGASGRLLRMLTGGLLGGKGAPTVAAKEAAAADGLTIAARELQMAAAALKTAAAGGFGMGVGRGLAGAAGGLNYVGSPGLSTSLSGDLAAKQRAAFAAMSKAEQAAIMAAAQPMGKALASATGMGLLGGVRSTVVGGAKSVLSAGKTILSGISKAFWPLLIADLGLEFVKAPLGDFIASNTPFKRAGAQMKDDFFGGLINLVKSWRIGSDLFIDLPEMQLGKSKFQTEALKGFQLTAEQVTALQKGGLEGALAQSGISKDVLDTLKQGAGEEVSDWFRRIRKTLEDNGVDVSSIAKLMPASGGPRGGVAMTPEKKAAMTKLLTDALAGLTSDTLRGVRTGLQSSVVEALKGVSGGRIPLSTILNLPQDAYKKLAELLVADARSALDPRVLALSLSELLNKPKPGKPTPPAKPGDAGGFYGQYGTSNKRLSPVIFDRSTIAETQKAFDKYISELTPDQATERQLGLKVLAGLNAGIANAGKDKGKRAALLAEVNKALGLTGNAAFADWTEFINWKATLEESTGETARLQIQQKLKEWSVAAAALGAQGGATEFWKQWGPEIAAADTAKEKEALRQKLNDLIPGTADDISKSKFAGWLLNVQNQANKDAFVPMQVSMFGLLGKLLTDPGKTIEGMGAQLASIINQATGTATSSPDLMAALLAAGKKIIAGIAAAFTPTALSKPLGVTLSGLKRQIPQSPVREGPLKHPFLFKAGENIVKQIGQGMERSGLVLPSLDMATAGGGRGHGVQLHADNLNVLGPADERSLIERLAFLGND